MQVVQNDRKPDFASLLQPAGHYQTPEAVLNDADLATYEKRVILSSWASDLLPLNRVRGYVTCPA